MQVDFIGAGTRIRPVSIYDTRRRKSTTTGKILSLHFLDNTYYIYIFDYKDV